VSTATTLTTPEQVAAFCARRTDDWQLLELSPSAPAALPDEVALVIGWHDGTGWGGERRRVSSLRLRVGGVSRYSLAGRHEAGTTLGYLVALEEEVGLLAGVPGDLEIAGARIAVEPLPERVEIAPYRLNPGRITIEAAAAWTLGTWRRALGEVDLVGDDGSRSDDLAGAPGLAWAIAPPGSEPGSGDGIWLQWLRPSARGPRPGSLAVAGNAAGGSPGTFANLVRQPRCGDALWRAALAATAALEPTCVTCGNVRFDAAAWRAFLASGTLPAPG